MNPFFMSMFVILADTAFSTSPRIANNPEDMFTVAEYFRENIVTSQDKDISTRICFLCLSGVKNLRLV